MTKSELTMAWHIASQESFVPDYKTLGWSIGFGLDDYKPRDITVEALATLICYQCKCLDCSWDMDAFDEIARHGKNKFLVHV
jgi:hypothetical protein